MSDAELRQLRRYLDANPNDYIVWAKYLQAGVRAGAYNPLDWNESVSWLTGETPQIRSPGDTYDYAHAERWANAVISVERLLHQVRNHLGQLSGERLAPQLQRVLDLVYAKNRKVEVNTTDYDYPSVAIDETYRVLYDEKSLHRKSENPRRPRYETIPRSVVDFTPQYIIDTDVYSHGGRDTPPDVDQVTLWVSINFSGLAVALVLNIESQENQEVFYDERGDDLEQLQQMESIPYRVETMRLIINCLSGIFSKYLLASYNGFQSEDSESIKGHIMCDKDFSLVILDHKQDEISNYELRLLKGGNQSTNTDIIVDPDFHSQNPARVIAAVWEAWLGHRLTQILPP